MPQPNFSTRGLDFDQIKQGLRDYLSNQDQFRDYDFDAAGISVLLDILAYNTHLNSFYGNMVANESFIDSALIRQSVVSHAKLLNYTPRSRRAARARVRMNFVGEPPQILQGFVPRRSVFTANVNGRKFTFQTLQNYAIEQDDNGVWRVPEMELSEGTFRNYSYTVDGKDEDQRFSIPDRNVDTSTIVVRVAASRTDTSGSETPWTLAKTLWNINGTSRVYFLQENEDGFYEVYFGDGILGQKPTDGNIISIEYMTTTGIEANGVGRNDRSDQRTFTWSLFPSQGLVEVLEPASTGSERENTESIRQNAPRAYQAQHRAVTAEDYRLALAEDYGGFDSIFVWGGEDSDPPVYGKVFISIKPTEGSVLSQSEKLSIANTILRKRNVVGITPEIVDPDFTYLLIDTEISFNPTKTNLRASDIRVLVTDTIRNFEQEELNKFEKNLRFSRFVRRIDDANPSIQNNQTNIRIQKRFEPRLNISTSYDIRFSNPFFHPEEGFKPVVASSGFRVTDPDTNELVTGFFDDDGFGNLRIYKLIAGERIYLDNNAGTVDYDKGEINILDFVPEEIPNDTQIRITVEPRNRDIIALRNQILRVDPADSNALQVSVQPISLFEGNLNSGTNFPFRSGS